MNKQRRAKIHKKVRAKVVGQSAQPRLFVFKSNKHIYAGVVDDTANKVLFSLSDKSVSGAKSKAPIELAKMVGEELAKKAIKSGYKEIVFDRGGYKYHGRIRALAEGARSAGLKF